MTLSEAIQKIIEDYQGVLDINSKSAEYQEGFIHALILLSELNDSQDKEILWKLLNAVQK